MKNEKNYASQPIFSHTMCEQQQLTPEIGQIHRNRTEFIRHEQPVTDRVLSRVNHCVLQRLKISVSEQPYLCTINICRTIFPFLVHYDLFSNNRNYQYWIEKYDWFTG